MVATARHWTAVESSPCFRRARLGSARVERIADSVNGRAAIAEMAEVGAKCAG
jgi:hypothetical protein